jgi:hypothetical protein
MSAQHGLEGRRRLEAQGTGIKAPRLPIDHRTNAAFVIEPTLYSLSSILSFQFKGALIGALVGDSQAHCLQNHKAEAGSQAKAQD